jgi:glutaredoxin
MHPRITVYGAQWSHDTQHALDYLDGRSVPFVFVDIDVDPDGERLVMAVNDGERRIPVIVADQGVREEVLIAPNEAELRRVVDSVESEAGDSAA